MNCLKAWKVLEGLLIALYPLEPKLEPLADKSSDPSLVVIRQELGPEQREQVQWLVQAIHAALSTHPGWTNVFSHHIATILGRKVEDNHRPLPKKMWGAIQKELEMMLTLRVVEESQSE